MKKDQYRLNFCLLFYKKKEVKQSGLTATQKNDKIFLEYFCSNQIKADILCRCPMKKESKD